MTVTPKMYGLAAKSMLNKELDWDTDTVKVMLCTSSYTPNQDTHRYKSDVTNEVTGTGYTAGGATLSGKTVTYDAGTHGNLFDCDDVVWAASTITAHYAVFYVDTGTAATSPLICYWDFGADEASSSTDFTLTIPPNALFASAVA